VVQDGLVRFALAGHGTKLTGPTVVARIRLPHSVTRGAAGVSGGVATDSKGGRYAVTSDGVDVSPPRTGATVFLPRVLTP
jgi:hypothetical protein